MKSSRTRFVSFLGETLDYQESRQIAPEVLDGLVTRLREGDRSVINTIIIGHLRMIMGILSGHRAREKAADVEGAALLALVEAVHDACPHTDEYGEYHESTLYDNNITAYITSTVKYAIKDEYGNNHILRVPPRTVRDKIAKGEKFENIVPGYGLAIGTDSDHEGGTNTPVPSGNFVLPFFVPIAKPEVPQIEFTEILNKSVENETERAIIRFRSEEYTYEETGKKVGLSQQRVGQLMAKIERKFDIYNK